MQTEKKKTTKIVKGQFGYLKAQKKREVLRTLLFFGLSLAVFIIGYLSTGTNKNLLTIVAVLGMLPASKSIVSTILYFKTKKFSKDIYEKTLPHIGKLNALYELVLTSYEKNFDISSIVISGYTIVGYSEWEKCDVNAAGKHIEKMLKQNSFTKENVKIFNDFEKYKNRLDQLNGKTEELPGKEGTLLENQFVSNEKTAEIIQLIKQISL